jgi:hypothetical protein
LTAWKHSPQSRRRIAWFVTAAAAITAGCADGPRLSEQNTPATSATQAPLELVRVAGTVVSGAEPGCLLLDTEVRRYHLVGGDVTALEPGQKVMVTGLADPNTTSSCEQTTPLTVSEVDPAS